MTKKGLFITHEGFGSSIFRSQVIEHCESLLDHDYDFDILTFDTFRKSRKESELNTRNYLRWGSRKITLKSAANRYFPFSTLANLFFLWREMKKLFQTQRYHFIHARADYTACLCVLLRPLHKLPVVWDCRGDSVDELKFSLEQFSWGYRAILSVLLVPRQRLFRYIASKCVADCICVSDAMQTLVLSQNSSLRTYVIPCPVPGDRFFFSEERRELARKQLGVSDDESLFIYSGSMTGYQSIENFRWYYEKIASLPKTKILIATIDRKKAEYFFRSISSDRITIITVDYEAMNDLYCAGDFALMSRDPRPLNYVASPTKFGEYCLTGLAVIHNNSIEQVSNNCNLLQNGLDLKSWPLVKQSIVSRAEVAAKSIQLYDRRLLNLVAVDCYNNI